MSGSVHDSHWLRMDDDRRIVGCQCGFAADESDEGYGDSVVKHIANEALIDAADALPVETEGPSRLGTARWPASYRDVYSLAIEEAQAAIRARAT